MAFKHTLYREKGCMKKIWESSRQKYNWFYKEENVTINKRKIKITSKCKSM